MPEIGQTISHCFSPKGPWLAYTSDENESGRSEIYVRAFPNSIIAIRT
jgi:hypothetical protein